MSLELCVNCVLCTLVLQASVGSPVTGKAAARLFEDVLPSRLVDWGKCLQCTDGQARMGIRYQELAAKGIDLPTGIEFGLVA